MRFHLIWLTCVFALSGLVPAAAQTVSFAPDTHPAATGARAAVSVDLNRDGWLDIATANTGGNTVTILLNRGSAGGFAPPREIAVGRGPFDIAAGDIDRDGIPDLVVATPDAPGIEVLLMQADARVKTRTRVSAAESRGVTLVDWNRDGTLDIVYSDYPGRRIGMLPGNGRGGFGAALTWGLGPTPQGVAAADFNHDGFVDIAVANTTGTVLTILQGTATTAVSVRGISTGRSHNVLAVADVNADGWLDIAAVSTGTNIVSFLKGGAAGFTLAGTRGVGSSPRGIATGDVNQDGRPDFAVTNRGSSSVTVLLARRDGSVVPTRWGDLPAGSGARGAVAGDLDNDGRIDLPAAAEFAASITTFTNDTAFVRAGFSFSRRMMPPLRNSDRGVAYADFNENGTPDVVRGRQVEIDGTSEVVLAITGSSNAVHDAATVDYNRDGHADIVCSVAVHDTNPVTGVLQVFLGSGRGTFNPGPIVQLPGVGGELVVGDVDRDGRPDVVVEGARTADGPRLFVVRQSTSGHVVSDTATDIRPLAMMAADMDRDGTLDLTTAERNSIVVRFGDGTGGFPRRTVLPLASLAWYFDLADLNHDGRLDIVVPSEANISVLLATGAGQWAPAVQYPVTPPDQPFNTAISVVVADFTADGHPDVFASNGSLLAGTGDGTFGPPDAFSTVPLFAVALDWNRDGLADFATLDGELVVNERRAVNRPPLANGGPDRVISYQGLFAQDDGSLDEMSTDPDLHLTTSTWIDENGQVFGTGSGVNLPVRPPGTYTFSVVVRDGRGGEATDTFQVTVLPEEEIVLWAQSNEGVSINGNWREVADTTAAGGIRAHYPNAGAPKVTTPLTSPASNIDISFVADPTQTYKLWVRLKAQDNRGANDSIWVQFAGAVDINGRPNYRIGTTEGLEVNLEECLGCRVSGWGWEDDGWGAINKNGTLLRFPQGGFQRLLIQVREDGVSVDQIVLSAVKYRTARPGTAKEDTTILEATQHFPQ